jgi:hypothetical protein
MSNFITYKTTTGQITGTGTCPSDMVAAQAKAGENTIEGLIDSLTQYINPSTEEVVSKEILPSSIDKILIVADEIDSCTISALPNPSLIEIEGEGMWEVTDGSFEFTTDTVGAYEFICRSAIHLDMEYTINAS